MKITLKNLLSRMVVTASKSFVLSVTLNCVRLETGSVRSCLKGTGRNFEQRVRFLVCMSSYISIKEFVRNKVPFNC